MSSHASLLPTDVENVQTHSILTNNDNLQQNISVVWLRAAGIDRTQASNSLEPRSVVSTVSHIVKTENQTGELF